MYSGGTISIRSIPPRSMALTLVLTFKTYNMKKLNAFVVITMMAFAAHAQNGFLEKYFQDGMFKFRDSLKIKRDDLFPLYGSLMGFTPDNQMVRQSSGNMDNYGGVSDRYFQYYKGIKVEGTMANVISKYGIVVTIAHLG